MPALALTTAIVALATSVAVVDDRRSSGADRDRGKPAKSESEPRVPRRDSVAVGEPSAGRLVDGVRLPKSGRSYFTWDPIRKTIPNRSWRRWGTWRTVHRTLEVARGYRRAHPRATPIAIGDLSRPRGGDFGPRYGLPGHASHQNGLDVDVYYPRRDGRRVVPLSAADVDRERAQELVDRFVAAGAELVLVGPSVGLTGPPGVVQPYPNHDDHLHARFPAPG